MRSARRRSALCLAVGIVAVGASASAQDPLRAVSLAWVRGPGAEGCPSQRAIRSAVRARLGRDPFRDDAAVTAEVHVARVEGRWRATLALREEGGAETLRRELSDASEGCDTVADAVVESLSLALDVAPPSPPPEAPPAPASAPVRAPPPTPTRARARTVLAAELLLGALPGLATGVVWRLEVPVARRWLHGWGSMALHPERDTPAPDDAWAFGMTRLSAGLCARWAPASRVDASGCAGLAFGLVHAVTRSASPIAPGNYPWAAATMEARAALRPAGPLVVELTAGVSYAFARNEFIAVGRAAPVYSQSLFAGAFSAGVGLDF